MKRPRRSELLKLTEQTAELVRVLLALTATLERSIPDPGETEPFRRHLLDLIDTGRRVSALLVWLDHDDEGEA